MKRVGVLLSGCGIYDGSEVQETVLVLGALARRGLQAVLLAPDVEQRDVVDHTTGEVVEGSASRSVLKESARVARGSIRSLAEAGGADLDALVVPGGFGCVKNLCLPGTRPLGGGPPLPEVAALLEEMRRRRAPVAALGLAEVVLARCAGRPLAPEAIDMPADRVVVSEDDRTVFSPGFMGTGDLCVVAESIERVADQIARWLATGGGATAPTSRR